MIKTGIYQIKSLKYPDRIYIGSAINIDSRWNNHIKTLRQKKHRNCKMQGHYDKYGECDLHFAILEECIKDNLINREQYYIDLFNPSFNICRKAGSPLGVKHSDEYKKRISERQKGRKLSEEHKKKIGISGKGRVGFWTGKKLSEETKKKMSIKRKGNKYRLGTHHSIESKQKLREACLRNGNKPPIKTKNR